MYESSSFYLFLHAVGIKQRGRTDKDDIGSVRSCLIA